VSARSLAVSLCAAVAAMLVMAVPASAWYSIKYHDGGGLQSGEVAYTVGEASREWNKVWRPAAYRFGLAYSGYAWVYDTWSNPFVDNRSAFYAQAQCLNASFDWVQPVTCMTTHP
jgi:hypothetical protein